MKLVGNKSAQVACGGRRVRSAILSASGLASAVVAGAILQAAAAIAADYTFTGNNSPEDQIFAAPAAYGNMTFDMGGGADSAQFNAAVTASGTVDFDGQGGDDTFSTSAGGSLTVTGATLISNTETLTNDGTLSTGILTYTGTAGDDVITNNGTLTVTGATAGFIGDDGDADSFTNNATKMVTVTGQAQFVGFESIANAGTFVSGAGFIVNGSDNDDTFDNSGTLNITGIGQFIFYDGTDSFTNSGTTTISTAGDFLGGDGDDTLTNTATGSLTVTGLTTISGFETVDNDGTINANGGVSYTGTSGADVYLYTGTGNFNVTGGAFTFNASGGNDDFTIDIGSKITVTGNNAVFDGGTGTDSFTNSGTVKTVTSGNISVQNFETVTNNGNTFDAAGNFSYTGTAANDIFTNNGSITAAGTGTFDGLDGTSDDLVNSVTGVITVTGLTTIQNIETVTNAGNINANAGLNYYGSAGNDTLAYTGSGTLDVTGALNLDGLAGTNGFTAAAGSHITVSGLTSIDNFSTFASNGSLGTNALDYDGTAGDDTFTNGGTLNVTTTADFDGGAGTGDALNNLAAKVISVGGLMTIGNIETVNNAGTINANGGLNYNGSAGNDALSYLGAGNLNVTGAFTLNGNGGTDSFTTGAGSTITVSGLSTILNIATLDNDGTINANGGLNYYGTLLANDTLVYQGTGDLEVTGAFTLDGLGGTDSFTAETGSNITVTGLTSIASFSTFSNKGSFSSGSLAYTGTTADDTFSNSGNLDISGAASLDGGLQTVADQLINGGTLTFGGAATIANFETVSNSGTMNVNTSLAITGPTAFTNTGTLNVDGSFSGSAGTNFTNGATGIIDMSDGATGDSLSVDGIFLASTGSHIRADITLNTLGTADTLTAGQTTGSTTLDLFGSFGPNDISDLAAPLVIVDSTNPGSMTLDGVTVNGVAVTRDASTNMFSIAQEGIVNYWLSDAGGDVAVQSVLDPELAGGVAAGFASTISSISAVFHKPVTPFVGQCKQDDADGIGYGTWARATGGKLDMSSSGSYSYLGTPQPLESQNKIDFLGLQGGFDVAACDDGDGRTLHGGVTIGNVRGESQQVNSPSGGLSADFNTTFVSAYSVLILASGFTADANIRYDFHDFDLSHSNPNVIDGIISVNGSTLSGTAGASYTFRVGDNILVRPNVGLAVSKTSFDDFNLITGNLAYKDQVSVLGTVGLAASAIYQISDAQILNPFVSASVYNEFGEDAEAVFDNGTIYDMKMSNVGTFEQVSAGLNIIGTAAAGSTEPNYIGTIRLDALFGDRLEGWSATAQARLQF